MIYGHVRVSPGGRSESVDVPARQLAKAGCKKVFRSLAQAWADTTTAHGQLMLTVLGGLAEFERELIRAHRRRP